MPPQTLPAVLAAALRDVPEQVALVEGDRRLTYADFAEEVDRVARALVVQGVEPGDRVAIWASNSIRWCATAVAIASVGGVLVTLNTRYKGGEAGYVLGRSRVRLVFVEDGFLGADYTGMLARHWRVQAATGQAAESAVAIVDMGVDMGDGSSRATSWAEFLAAGTAIEASVIAERTAALDPDGLADLMFTSGTTGEPKGVMTAHGANIAVFESWAEMIGLRPGDRYLLVNPLFHAFGFRAGLTAALTQRIPLHLLPTFDPVAAMEIIEREGITFLPGAPAIYTTLLDHPERVRFDLSSLRLVVTGAAVVPMALIHRIRDELGVATVITAYGQTEATGTITVCPPTAPDEKISRTAGVAIPGVEVKIVDGHGEPCPAGQAGEICSRGYNTMLGYLDNPEATAEAIDADGWLHTGDVGHLDDEGYLTITDRIKDMYTVGGFNVYPAEVERCLMTHPAVADSAVIARPDDRLGEAGHAVVVLRSGVEPSDALAAGLIAHCRDQLANFKAPRTVAFADTLPRNPSGKVQKFKLIEEAHDG